MTTSRDSPDMLRHAATFTLRGRTPVRSQTYEITFAGQAGSVVCAEFDDCEVTIGSGTTSLRAELPDPAAFAGLMQRIAALRLEVIHVHLVATSSEP
jgi:hypothetical protein